MASTSWYSETSIKQEQEAEQISSDDGDSGPEFEAELDMSVSNATQRFCRLCLSKEQQLKPLFPPSGIPDQNLLDRILNCLTISLSFEEDYDTYICRICILEVTKFFLYKEQCLANDSILRHRRKPDKAVFFEQEQNEAQDIENTLVDNNDDDDEPLDEGEPIDSDEFDIRDEEDYDAIPPNTSEFRIRLPYRVDPDLSSGKLKPLPRSRARRVNVQDYYFAGFRYTCATSRANGKVHWRCMYKSKLRCRAAILVAPDGTVSRGPHRHNHQSEQKTTHDQPSSVKTILDVHTGRSVSYRLITSSRSPINPMQLICDGYKYRYARTTQKKTTYWRCMKHNGKENCKAVLSFRLDFSSCSSNGLEHNHPAQYNMEQQAKFQSPDSQNDSDLPPQVFISQNGSRSNDYAQGFGKQKGKRNILLHKGYEFGFPRIERKNTKWACFKKSLFNCPANVLTNWAGKVLKESDWAHNHGPTDNFDSNAVIEGYMQDAKTKEQVFYKSIPGKRGQRFVVYNGYRYSSDRLISDGRIAWKCTKCKVFVVIGGRFAVIEDRGGEHEHQYDDKQVEESEQGTVVDSSYHLQENSFAAKENDDLEVELSIKNEQIEDNSSNQYDAPDLHDANDEHENVDYDDDDDDDDDSVQMIIP